MSAFTGRRIGKVCLPYNRQESIAAFMAKVYPEPNSGCWLWGGSANRGGYGNFWMDKQCLKAHRAAHVLFIGPIPPEHDVMHRCDTPACVNPEHIRAATTRDNIRDMWAKGRGNPPKGIRNRHAKLTWDGTVRVWELATLIELPTAEIARRMHISTSRVRGIVRSFQNGK